MSNYVRFVTDFSDRCNELLQCFEKSSLLRDREVTLMLCMATAGFGIPFERIRPTNPHKEHPARDRKKHDDLRKLADDLLKKPFKETTLWDNSFEENWFFSKEVSDESKDLEDWPELNNPQKLSNAGKDCESVLINLRNSLAHGNVFISGNPISQIILLSKPPSDKRYSMHAVTPDIFRRFLGNWFKFLAKASIPEGLIENNIIYERIIPAQEIPN